MKQAVKQAFAAVFAGILLIGCAYDSKQMRKESSVQQQYNASAQEGLSAMQDHADTEELTVVPNYADTEELPAMPDHADTEELPAMQDSENLRRTRGSSQADASSGKEILRFVDVFGQEYKTEVDPDVKKHDYCLDAFVRQGDRLHYEGDERYSSRLGVDVSKHQGAIDWKKVKADGYTFAFIRIGYRGYGKEGRICLDKEFVNNIQGAQAAGMDTGVYFFSQAVNEEEAAAEAEFVLKHLKGYKLQLPVVYDPESILDAPARTDDVTGAQFTKNTQVFCQLIKEGGYEPMIYSNMLWEAYQFDLAQLAEYPIWYADYEELPQTPYHFTFWQYTSEGTVDGIAGNTDLDIQLLAAES